MRRLMSADQARGFLSAEDGATAIEYALIAAGIAGAIVAVVTSLGGLVNVMWTSVKNALG